MTLHQEGQVCSFCLIKPLLQVGAARNRGFKEPNQPSKYFYLYTKFLVMFVYECGSLCLRLIRSASNCPVALQRLIPTAEVSRV